MTKKFIAFLLATIVSLNLYSQEKSPFEACRNVVMIKESSYKSDKANWDKKFKDCKDLNFQIIPDSSILSMSYVEGVAPTIAASMAAIDFLTTVGQSTVKSLRNNINVLATTEKCLKGETPSKAELDVIGKEVTCKKLELSIKLAMKENVPALRSELSFLGQLNMNHSEESLRSLDSSKLIDESLDNSGGLIAGGVPHAKLKKMTPEEKSRTKALYDSELKEIRKEWLEKTTKEVTAEVEKMGFKPTDSRFKTFFDLNFKTKEKSYITWGRSKLYENQKKHEANYMKIAQRSPFLLHVGNENPENAEIAESIPKLIKSAKDELERSEKALKSATINYEKYKSGSKPRGGGKQDTIDDLLYFLGNAPVVEAVLKDNNKGCATANGLLQFVSNEKTRDQLVLMSAMFGGVALLSTKVPALLTGLTGVTWTSTAVGALMGAPLGIYFEKEAYDEAQLAKDKYNAGVGSLAKVKETSDSLAIQTLLHPLDFIGVGAAIGKTARAAEVAVLKKSGLTDNMVNNLVKLSESSDASIALQAQKEIAKYSWKDLIGKKPTDSEISLVEKLLKSGAIPADVKAAKLADTMKLIQRLSVQEQDALSAMYLLNLKGAKGLMLVHESIANQPGVHSELFLKKLESLGVPKPLAKKMCQCARACGINITLNSEEKFKLLCSL